MKTDREALQDVVDAWESLPGGRNYPVREVEAWLIEKMQPVIDVARGVLISKLVPVKWECKDYADGWIPFDKESEALEYQRDSGCLLRVIYKEVKQ